MTRANFEAFTSQTNEIDLFTLWRGVRHSLPWTVLVSVLVAGAVWYLSAQQSPVYEARSSLLVAGAGTQPTDSVLGGALVKASPLPQGALEGALHGSIVMEPLIDRVASSKDIAPGERLRLAERLKEEMGTQNFSTVQLVSRVEAYNGGNGIYTVTARASSSEAAATLANLTAQALLDWDKERALSNVRLAQQGFKAQLDGLETQLENVKLGTLERDALISQRTNLLESLTQVNILEHSTTGVLSLLSPATEPVEPVAPKPTRNAVLVGLLTMLVGLGAAVVVALNDRRARTEEDLAELGLPTLATLSSIKRRDVLLGGIVKASRQAGLYEAMGFLRVNLMTALDGKEHPVIMVTSSAPGEGKSSVTATLADGLASSGRRVLIIDADLRRGTQYEIWNKGFLESPITLQLIGDGGARNTREALSNPNNVQVMQVAENIDLLPAGAGVHDTLSNLTRGEFKAALEIWSPHYDVVLIDSAPLLALADGLVVGSAADGVVMVVEYAKTDLRSVRAALRRAERNGIPMLGFVLNKVQIGKEKSYGYVYDYSQKVSQR